MVKETRLYDLLDVSADADEHEIKKSFRTLALKYHPDKLITETDKNKEKKIHLFRQIIQAYEILSDLDKKYIYDNYGEDAVKSNSQPGLKSTSNVPFTVSSNIKHNSYDLARAEHLFEHFFGDSLKNSANAVHDQMMNFANSFPFGPNNNSNNNKCSSNGQKKFKKGRDILHVVYCTLDDYYNGKKIRLRLSKRVKCKNCNGLGGSKIFTCTECHGNGVIVSENRMGMIYQRTQVTCNRCRGSGEFTPHEFLCVNCHGNKLVDTTIILSFDTPKGVGNGYNVVFPNAADEGINLIPGDVIITLRDDNNKINLGHFRRFNDDLLSTVKIPLLRSICGGYVKFRHINGDCIKLYIKKGEIQYPNQIKVAKGYGMPIFSSNNDNNKDKIDQKFGDLLLKFEIALPQLGDLSENQYSLLSKALVPNADLHVDKNINLPASRESLNKNNENEHDIYSSGDDREKENNNSSISSDFDPVAISLADLPNFDRIKDKNFEFSFPSSVRDFDSNIDDMSRKAKRVKGVESV